MNYEHTLTTLFIICLITKALVETYLYVRNKQHILRWRSRVPQFFSESISLSEHQKAADYSVAKINFHLRTLWPHVLILLAWTLGGGIDWLGRLSHKFSFLNTNIRQGLFVIGGFGIISGLLGLVEGAYSTFVIEERFGYNRTTVKTFLLDALKGFILSVVLATPLLSAVLWTIDALGTHWWIAAFGIYATFQLILMWAYPQWIAPLFNKFTPLEDPTLKNTVATFLKAAEFPFKDLFVMDASKRSAHGNAYFTGIGKEKRIVFFDTLLKTLTPDQTVAVLAHEVGHFKHRHVLIQLVLSMIFTFMGLYLLSLAQHWPLFYTDHGVRELTSYNALLLFLLVVPSYTFFFTPAFSYLSRKFEFQADEYAKSFGKAPALIQALIQMYKENSSTLTPDPLFSAYYHSHPPALIRVGRLLNETGSLEGK